MSATPTVYFIDDSATMREVIKIAFRRENINVVACHSATTAMGQMEQLKPDVVISDLIMPEKDGYEVCQYVKQHPRLNRIPVILMSGVVNRAVAEKAFAVKADELIRKPFQPQDLITRVRHLLNPKGVAVRQIPPAAASAASAALSSIFSTPVNGVPMQARAVAQRASSPLAAPAVPAASGAATQTAPLRAPIAREMASMRLAPAVSAAPAPAPRSAPPPPVVPAPAKPATTLELQKLKIEIQRLEGLVKKLQSELLAEREYSHALEEHVKTLQEAE